MSHSKNESDDGLTNQSTEAKRQIETLLDEESEKNKTNFRWLETPQGTTNTNSIYKIRLPLIHKIAPEPEEIQILLWDLILTAADYRWGWILRTSVVAASSLCKKKYKTTNEWEPVREKKWSKCLHFSVRRSLLLMEQADKQ